MPTPPPHALGRPKDSPEPEAAPAPAKSNGLPPATRTRNAAANRWADSSEAEFNESVKYETDKSQQRLDDISDYTTPLDISKIPVEVQEKAARLAAEIEGEQQSGGKKGYVSKGGPRKGGGKDGGGGKDYGDRKGDYGGSKGGGKDRDRDGSSPKGKGKDGKGGSKGKSGSPSSGFGGGGGGFMKDDAFDDWVSQRRQQRPAGIQRG
jgi:hypothetical protein